MSEKEPKEQDPYEIALKEVIPSREIAAGYAKAFRDFAKSLTSGGEVESFVFEREGAKEKAVKVLFRGWKGNVVIGITKGGFAIISRGMPFTSFVPLSSPILPAEGKHGFVLCTNNGFNMLFERKTCKDFDGKEVHYPVTKVVIGKITNTLPK